MSKSIKQQISQKLSKPVPTHIKDKISAKLKGTKHREYSPLTEDSKIKMSCTKQGIIVDDFNGFKTPISQRERAIFNKSTYRIQCFQKADFTCDICSKRGCKLNAHHLNSWHANEEDRFNIDNLVCLCEDCHKNFHSLYTNKNNTKDQYEEFKKNNGLIG